jgi:hypothetical protein
VKKTKKIKAEGKKSAGYYDRADILHELAEQSVEFRPDDQLLRDILKRKRKRKL